MTWEEIIRRLKARGLKAADVGKIAAWLKTNRTLVAIAAGIVVAAGFYGAVQNSDTVATASAQPTGSLATNGGGTASIGALGRIEPESEIIEIGGPSDERVASLVVKEGDPVTKGQALGYFQSHEQRAADADRFDAKLKEAERLLDAETKSGEAAIYDAEVRIKRATELFPLRIRGQEAKIRRIQAELTNNRDILESRKELRAKEYQSRRSVDDQRSLVRQNEENLKSEKEELDRLKAEMHLEELSAKAALQRARADMARAQAAAGVDSMRAELAVAKARVREATLTAPIDGQILKILTRAGARVGSEPILKMGNTREMHAVAEVYETDVGRVKIGQRATIISRALPKAMTGKVVRIGRMIFKNDVLRTDPAAKVDARVVEVRILLDDSTAAANLTNLTVDVVIHADDKPTVADKQGAGRS
jgi:HlyD family secretion protein